MVVGCFIQGGLNLQQLDSAEVPFNVLFVPLIDVQHLMRRLCEGGRAEVSPQSGQKLKKKMEDKGFI